MSNARLQIKLLSASGELLNVVNATAGRLTVLRSFSPSQLEPYRRAIAGVPGPERIVVTLNGNEFIPEDHILIGFGENTRGIPGTVTEHLVAAGVNANAVSGLLMSYGLAEVAQNPFSRLTACETQRCRLLAGLQQNSSAIVLNNPFEPLASEWRERFAELMLQYVRSSDVPVLVTSMSYRPECFINNEIIQRVQVGENDQRTIGFGSAPSEYEELIKRVRKDSREQANTPVFPDKAQNRREKPEHPGVHPDRKQGDRKQGRATKQQKNKKKHPPQAYGIGRLLTHRSVRRVGALVIGGAASLAILLSVQQQAPQHPTLVQQTSNATEDPLRTETSLEPQRPVLKLKEPELPLPENPADLRNEGTIAHPVPAPDRPGIVPVVEQEQEIFPPHSEKEEEPAPEPQRKAPRKKTSPLMLDTYSNTVKNSILASFEGTENARAANLQFAGLRQSAPARQEKERTSEQENAFTRSLLHDLQKTDGSGKHLPDAPSGGASPARPFTSSSAEPPDYKNMSKEDRRALLREKFRLAIERAAQNR